MIKVKSENPVVQLLRRLSLPAAGMVAGSTMTATATRVSTGDTSEFSACIAAVGNARRHSGRDFATAGQ